MTLRTFFILISLCSFVLVSCLNTEKKENQKLIIELPVNSLDSQLNALTKKIIRHPEKDELYFQRAKLFKQKGKLLLATHDMGKAIALQAQIFEYFNLAGDLYFETNNIKSAIDAYEKSCKLNPDNEYAFLQLGKIYLYTSQLREAIAYLNKAVEANKFNPDIYNTISLYFLQKNDTIRAIESLKTAVKIDPENLTAYRNLGELLLLTKNKDALLYLNNALRVKADDIASLYNRGKYYQDKDSFNLAISDYENILSLEPNHKSANYNLGYINYLLDKYEQSISYFSKVISLNPDKKEAYLGRGMCYAALKNNKLAADDFNKILLIDPKDEIARKELMKLSK